MATEQELAQKFLTDESFRAKLKEDPKGALSAHGVQVPEGVDIEVVESTPSKQYIVLPPLQSEELRDEQLAAAQGGTIAPITFICTYGGGC